MKLLALFTDKNVRCKMKYTSASDWASGLAKV